MPADPFPTDPFEALAEPIVPLRPRDAFATELRTRIERLLGPEPGGTTMTTTASEPAAGARPRATALQAYICVDGAAAAIDFYTAAFGAVENVRMVDDRGRIGHAEIAVGDVEIMLADEHREMGVLSPTTLGGSPVLLYLVVDDVDAVHDAAVGAGATSERPPEDQFHGNRTATVRDPFGHRWMLSAPIEEVAADEYVRRGEAGGYTTTFGEPTADAGPVVEVGYFTLTTPDVDRAASFYGELFGWQVDPGGPSATGHTYRHVSNTRLPFGFHDDPAGPSPHHYYRVDDIEAMAERVRRLGGEVLTVDTHPSGGNARCRDDQGVEFDLWQPAPGY